MLVNVAPRLSWPVYLAGEERDPDGRGTRHSQVNYLGHLRQQELQIWLGRAAIYAAPARYEPFGLSVLEAALAGCALVLGDIPSLRENWDDAAIYVPPTDSSALREALLGLIRFPDTRANFARRAHARALTSTPQLMATSYV